MKIIIKERQQQHNAKQRSIFQILCVCQQVIIADDTES